MRVKVKKIKNIEVRKRRSRRSSVLLTVKVKARSLPLPPLGPSASLRTFSLSTLLKASSRLSWVVFKGTALAMVSVLLTLSLFSAFEAHVINVTAEPVQIDPPILTPPGDIGWDNPIGVTDATSTIDVFFTDPDPDATHIYFTYGEGTDPNLIPNPVCGQPGPNGGGDDKIPLELVALSLTSDTVVKAIACDGDDGSAHSSVINTKIYTFIYACPPTEVTFPNRLAVQAGGSSTLSADDILAAANVDIFGNARSNHDINGSNSSPNRLITGNAMAGNNVQQTRFVINGNLLENATSTSLPDIQIPVWQAHAAAGGTINGSIIIPGSAGTTSLGPTEIMGNLEINGNNTINILGPLYVHGNLTVDSNVQFNQDAIFGDSFTTIIVGGTIDIDSNVEFTGSGTKGAFLLVSTAGPQAGTNAAIDIANDNSDLGDAVLYASAGDIHINSNRTVLAVFATAGTDASEPAVHLESNVQVVWRELPDTILCGEKFARPNQVVINEFMPNPIGSDQGAAGLPLDGEWVELYNGMNIPANVNNWVLYDVNNANELIISLANSASSTTTICPGCHLVVYRDGDVDFEINNSNGDTVRLYNAEIGLGGSLVDSHVFTTDAPENKSFARIPDGSNNWIDPEPTPGDTNDSPEFFNEDTTPTDVIVYDSDPDEYDGFLGDDPLPVSEEPSEATEGQAGEVAGETTSDQDLTDLSLDPSPSPGEEENSEPALSQDPPQVENMTTTEPMIFDASSGVASPPPEETAPAAEETPAEEPAPVSDPSDDEASEEPALPEEQIEAPEETPATEPEPAPEPEPQAPEEPAPVEEEPAV